LNFLDQIRSRRLLLGKPVPVIGREIAMQLPNLYRVLTGKHDTKASTLEALAASLNAEWVLVPKHFVPEVARLVSGKTLALDDVPSAIERMLDANK